MYYLQKKIYHESDPDGFMSYSIKYWCTITYFFFPLTLNFLFFLFQCLIYELSLFCMI